MSGLQWFAIARFHNYKEGMTAIVVIVAERDDHLEVNCAIEEKWSVSESEGAVRKRNLPMYAGSEDVVNGAEF